MQSNLNKQISPYQHLEPLMYRGPRKPPRPRLFVSVGLCARAHSVDVYKRSLVLVQLRVRFNTKLRQNTDAQKNSRLYNNESISYVRTSLIRLEWKQSFNLGSAREGADMVLPLKKKYL